MPRINTVQQRLLAGNTKALARSITLATTTSAAISLQSWTTGTLTWGAPTRTGRDIIMICARHESGNNAIYNWTLGGVTGTRLFALAGSGATIDVASFKNVTTSSGTISATGGTGSLTKHYAIALYNCYGFGLINLNQTGSEGDGGTWSNDRIVLANQTTSTLTPGTAPRRQPYFYLGGCVANWNPTAGTNGVQTISGINSDISGSYNVTSTMGYVYSIGSGSFVPSGNYSISATLSRTTGVGFSMQVVGVPVF